MSTEHLACSRTTARSPSLVRVRLTLTLRPCLTRREGVHAEPHPPSRPPDRQPPALCPGGARPRGGAAGGRWNRAVLAITGKPSPLDEAGSKARILTLMKPREDLGLTTQSIGLGHACGNQTENDARLRKKSRPPRSRVVLAPSDVQVEEPEQDGLVVQHALHGSPHCPRQATRRKEAPYGDEEVLLANLRPTPSLGRKTDSPEGDGR